MQNKLRSVTTLVMFSLLSIALSAGQAYGQHRKAAKVKSQAPVQALVQDSAAFGTVEPYRKIITRDARVFDGLFKVIKVNDRYFFEIPDSLMERDIHVISRITEGPAKLAKATFNYAGDDLGDAQISFSKGPNNKLFIRQLVYRDKASDSTEYGLQKALLNNNLQPVLSVFDIKAFGKDSSAVIDVTDYLNGDQQIITGNLKTAFRVQNIETDKSYIEEIYAYPGNIDVQMVKTYSAAPAPITLKMNTSFVLMPKIPMALRFADERVGYRSLAYNDFDIDPQRARVVEKICRWQMIPREADKARYLRGELVEPEKPIVFYIDPNTPQKWVPYLVAAVDDWQRAFETAGFKNAIYARVASSADTTWDTRDDRFNTIIYAPSLSAQVKSNVIIDPRSGEIIHANIHIDHNILQQLHDLYMIQASQVDPEAHEKEYSSHLMGELLKLVVSAEVGNTLGLLNNAGASATVPLAKIKDRNWVRAHGFCPSILRDAIINYTATPEDHFTPAEMLGRIGEYDHWAIDWGYRWLPQFRDAYEEQPYQRKRIIDSLAVNPRLFFSPEPAGNRIDARALPANLGDDVVKASDYGIQNLKRLVPNLPVWTERSDLVYSTNDNPIAGEMSSVQSVLYTYLDNVTGVLGTGYYNPHGNEDSSPVYTFVPKAIQKNAIGFLNREIFVKEPDWLTSSAIRSRGLPPEISNTVYEPAQNMLSNKLLDINMLKNISSMADRFGAVNTMSLSAYLSAMDACIWPELTSGKTVSTYHIALQRTFINSLGMVVNTKRDPANTNVIALTRGYLFILKQRIGKVLPAIHDPKTKMHYQDIIRLLTALTDARRAVQPTGPTQTVNMLTLFGQQNLDY